MNVNDFLCAKNKTITNKNIAIKKLDLYRLIYNGMRREDVLMMDVDEVEEAIFALKEIMRGDTNG